MTRVVYATKARRDIIRIIEKIAAEDPNAATKFAHQLEHHCSLLARTPAMGRKRPDVGIGVRSLIQGNYLIFYRVSVHDDQVEILHVRHGSRRLPPMVEFAFSIDELCGVAWHDVRGALNVGR